MKYQGGFGIIELLIALTLGLVMITGTTQIMLATRVAYSATEDTSRIQENARFALGMLARDVRMAGYQNPLNESSLPAFFVTDACGAFDPCTANDVSDRIAIQYDPPSDRDCLGNAVGADDVIANVYQNSNGSLTCRGWNVTQGIWNSAEEILVDGIDNLQVLYGMAINQSTTQFVASHRVTDWANIQSVRIGLLVSDGTPLGASDSEPRSYILLDNGPLTFTDTHQRHIYSTTIVINNAFNG